MARVRSVGNRAGDDSEQMTDRGSEGTVGLANAGRPARLGVIPLGDPTGCMIPKKLFGNCVNGGGC